MLSDYINKYKEAVAKNDKKAMERIEKDLSKLGMDKYTLTILVKELSK